MSEAEDTIPDPGEVKVAAAVAHIYWDGKMYYGKSDGRWWDYTTEPLKRTLTVDCGLDGARHKRETCSEVDRALRYIERHNRVAGAVPIVFVPDDIVYLNGQKFLNTSHVKPMPPADGPQEWGVNFPWIAAFLAARFLENERPYMLGWLKRAYTGALEGVPKRGHALFLVGKHALGKTLFSNKIVGGALGGCADASSHIAKGSEFNKELGETGLLCIDDGEVASDPQSHRRFSEVVKKVVANPLFTWRKMRVDPQTIPFNARLIITLNDDPSSVQMIPDLAMSMEEKVMVLRFDDGEFTFEPNHIQEAKITAELPFFLRWLLDWEMPAEIVGTSRFGVNHFINEELRAKALHAGGVSDVLEIMDSWIKRSAEGERGPTWRGSATEWMAQVGQDDVLRPLVNKFSAKSLGKKLSEASRIRGSGIRVVPNGSRGNLYEIDLVSDLASGLQ